MSPLQLSKTVAIFCRFWNNDWRKGGRRLAMEGCTLTGGKQKECAGTLKEFQSLHQILQEKYVWWFSINYVVCQIWRGSCTGQTPFPTRRISEANEGTFEYELLICSKILILPVKAKADQSEGGIQEAAAQSEGRVPEAAGEGEGGEERKEDEKEGCIQLIFLLILVLLHFLRWECRGQRQRCYLG